MWKMGDRAQIWRDTQNLVINYVLVRTSRTCFNTKYDLGLIILFILYFQKILLVVTIVNINNKGNTNKNKYYYCYYHHHKSSL